MSFQVISLIKDIKKDRKRLSENSNKNKKRRPNTIFFSGNRRVLSYSNTAMSSSIDGRLPGLSKIARFGTLSEIAVAMGSKSRIASTIFPKEKMSSDVIDCRPLPATISGAM